MSFRFFEQASHENLLSSIHFKFCHIITLVTQHIAKGELTLLHYWDRNIKFHCDNATSKKSFTKEKR